MSKRVLTEEQKENYRKYRRDWYYRNREHAKGKVKARRKELKAWLRELKSQLKCNRCEEDHIACLKFHHTNPDEKEENISRLVGEGAGKEFILKEMEKCEVVCSNCHRKIHFELNTIGV